MCWCNQVAARSLGRPAAAVSSSLLTRPTTHLLRAKCEHKPSTRGVSLWCEQPLAVLVDHGASVSRRPRQLVEPQPGLRGPAQAVRQGAASFCWDGGPPGMPPPPSVALLIGWSCSRLCLLRARARPRPIFRVQTRTCSPRTGGSKWCCSRTSTPGTHGPVPPLPTRGVWCHGLADHMCGAAARLRSSRIETSLWKPIPPRSLAR